MKTIDTTALIKKISDQLEPEYKDQTLCQQYAWWALQTITNQNKSQLIAHETIMLSPEQEQQLVTWINKLVHEHMPIQYLIGSVPFNGVDILVEPPVLIPRPETEEWCLKLIEQLKRLDQQQLMILDLATGSGCIALALAHHLPQATIYASDISPQALDLAQKNTEHNKVSNVTLITSDLFESLPQGVTFDLIVSNPPYISPDEWQQLDTSVTKWEDKQALLASDDGLAIIKKIIATAPHYIKSNKEMQQKKIPQVIIEIGYKQGEKTIALLKQAKYNAIKVHKDLEKKDRYVTGRVDYVATATTQ